MNKFTLLTFDSLKDVLLKELQKFGDVHFKNLSQDEAAELDFLAGDYSGEAVSEIESELARVNFAIRRIEPFIEKKKGLKKLTEKRQSITFDEFERYTSVYDYKSVYSEIKQRDEELKTYKAEKTRLVSENQSLSPWAGLDVPLTQFDQLKSVKYFIGTVTNAEVFREAIESRHTSAYIEFFGKTKDETAVIIVVPAEEYDAVAADTKTLGFSKSFLAAEMSPAEVVSANKARIVELEKLENEAERAIIEKSGEYSGLMIAFDHFSTLLERAKARENFLKVRDGVSGVLLIEGWTPESNVGELKRSVEAACADDFYLEIEEVPRDSAEVPIKLKNNRFVAAFEDITAMYSMPRYNELDPTPVLAPFYFLFFGLMMGDAGYGLTLVVGTSLALKFFTLKDSMKRFMRFFRYLGYATIIGGILYGSMFGYSFFTPLTGPDGAPKAILSAETDITLLLVFSIALGFVHLIFGLCVKGYMLVRDGKWLDAIFDSLFWIVAIVSMVGLIVGMAGIAPSALTTVFQWGLILSLVGLLFTQGREYPSIAGKIGGGVYGVYGITSYIGDLVSYTRIAALMLSGAYIAFAFNTIADIVRNGPISAFFAMLIVVIGALLNVGLSALGAYVHTCRLQYVEFFGKFYEGGGRPFKPFEIKNTFVDVQK